MILSERKIRILEAIINDYIQMAEPIGSRTIAKKYDMGISSATIRNEMSDLEDMGLIVQPHASAGRIPSDKGYRLYVDSLMHRRELSQEEMEFLHSIIAGNISQIDYLMSETAKAITLLTNYTTIISRPYVKMTKLKHVQLVPVDEKSILLVLITDGNQINNKVINVEKAPDYIELNRMTELLNAALHGKSAEELDAGLLESLADKLGGSRSTAETVLNTILDTMLADNEVSFYTSGVKNILEFPEFSDIQKAKSFFRTLEEKEVLVTILGEGEEEGIQVIIGEENRIEPLRDCSLIKANYMLTDQTYGSIGIIGPTRMDYTQAVAVLNGILKNINAALKAFSGG